MLISSNNQNEDVKIFNAKYENLEENYDIEDEFLVVEDILDFDYINKRNQKNEDDSLYIKNDLPFCKEDDFIDIIL